MIQSVGASRVLDGLATLAGVGTRSLRTTSTFAPTTTQPTVQPTQPVQPSTRRADRVQLSPQAQAAADQAERGRHREPNAPRPATRSEAQPANQADTKSTDELTEQEKQHVRELKQRDREVRAHEQAHKAAGGQHAGAISYQYTTGPDGQRYVTSGEVSVDASPVKDDPQATIDKMKQVRSAALAPAQPSAADRQIAAKARREELKAQAELAEAGNDASSAPPSNDAEPDASNEDERNAIASSAASSPYADSNNASADRSQLVDLVA